MDHAIGVGHVYKYIPAAIKEAHHMQLLEQKAAPLVEYSLTILQITRDMDRTDLTAGDTDVTRILGQSQRAFDAARYRAADVAGHTLYFRIIEPVYCNSIVGSQEPKSGAYLACRTSFRPTPDPYCKGEHQ